jgi:hypothetical protein
MKKRPGRKPSHKGRKRTSFNINKELIRLAWIKAKMEGRTLSDVVEEGLRDQVKHLNIYFKTTGGRK